MPLVLSDSPTNPFFFTFTEPLFAGPDPKNFAAAMSFTFTNNPNLTLGASIDIDPITDNMGNTDRFGNNPVLVSFVTAGTTAIETTQTTGAAFVSVNVPRLFYERIGAGETVVMRWTVKVSDTVANPDQTDTTELRISITGRNDLPTAVNDAITVSDEVARFDNGAVLANDKDTDIHDVFVVTAVGAATAATAFGGTILPAEYVAQTPGTATLDSNSVIVDFNRYYKFLAPGESVRFSVPYTMSDGHGGTSIANVVSTITGTATATFKGTAASEQMLGENDVDKMLGDDGNDTIFARAGNDLVNGEKGDDVVVGGLGADDLFGEKGADIFRYLTIADSGKKGSARDAILDFDGKDKVDLSPIDPIAGGVDDVFKWRGTKNFTGTGPEVNYDKKGSKIILFADANGDGKAEFSIQFNGLSHLDKGDLVL